ncbi:MAG: D-alanyl-D-alanine carboxypeptidase/D-alanyl-D-alanine-endopeptidase [Modestobacter sp.]|nr:D-alanyl-D-alanine carboxypeptidase/D-alanyl-D-alanine-endopeptidase [Modestobacter sp.]
MDGSLAGFCTSCPAKGRVFAKPGTVAGEDGLNGRIEIGVMTLGGYLDVGGGRYEVFYDGVTGTTAPDITGGIDVLGDVADIAAFAHEDAAAAGPPPR